MISVPADIPKWGQFWFVPLNDDEIAVLDQKVNGIGGFESFLRVLQTQVNHSTKTIKLTEDDIVNMGRFAFDYKQGGWEGRLLKTFGRALGPRLGRVDEQETGA
jgi:hypothetical protein